MESYSNVAKNPTEMVIISMNRKTLLHLNKKSTVYIHLKRVYSLRLYVPLTPNKGTTFHIHGTVCVGDLMLDGFKWRTIW